MAEERKQYKREGKKYELKKSAARAAREDGLKDDQFEVVPNGKEWSYKTKGNKSMKDQLDKHLEKEKSDAKEAKKRAPVGERPTPGHPASDPPTTLQEVAENIPPLVMPPELKAELTPAPVKPPRQLTPDEQYRLDMAEANERKRAEAAKPKSEPTTTSVLPPEKVLPAPGPAPRVMKVVPQSQMPQKNRLHKSQIESPTKTVWAVADEMFEKNPSTTRKQVIEECTKRGIAYFTARTQYQQWLSARRESEENARKANGKKPSKK